MAVKQSDLKVEIEADSAKAEAALERVRKSTLRLESSLSSAALAAAELDRELDAEASRAAEERAESLDMLGKSLLAFGAISGIALGLAAYAAIKWESAWTGVRKVVDGSDAELAKLEDGLRELALTLPTTHQEIAKVAEAAGTLGIKAKDIVQFTRVMIDLGQTTDLSAEQAADAIARFTNIMGTSTSEVDRLGATLVDLGNNGAATESEILEMALRIAGAGKVAGFTEADVLALASSLSSVGIKAEMGGSAISRVMIDIANAVAMGGESVSDFARIAGMSAEEFTVAFETDPARAMQAFVAGLGNIDKAGGNVFKTLEDLNLSEIRVRDTMLRLSGAGDLLSEALKRGEIAWDQNSALVKEAAQRYDTAEARIGIARNTVVDFAIDVGAVLLPAIAGMADGIAAAFRWFSDLPGPIKAVGTILGVMVTTVSLLAGAYLLLAPRIAAVQAQMTALAVTMPRLALAMRAFTLAIPVVGILLAVAGGIAAIASASDDGEPSVGRMTRALLNLADSKTDKIINDLRDAFKDIKQPVDKATQSADVFVRQMAKGAETKRASEAAKEYAKSMGKVDEALTGLVEGGHVENAAEIVQKLHKNFARSGESVEEFAKRMLPDYVEALANADTQTELSNEKFRVQGDVLTELGARFGLTGDDAAAAAQKMLDSWAEAFTEFVDLNTAYQTVLDRKTEAEREAAQGTAEATGSSSDSWQDFVGQVHVSGEELIAELKKMVKAQENWRSNMVALAAKVPPEMMDYLAKLGPEGAALVETMTNMTDKELKETIKLFGRSGKYAGNEFADSLGNAGPLWQAIASKHGKRTVDKLVGQLVAGKISWRDILRKYGHLVNSEIPDSKKVKVFVRRMSSYWDIRNIVDTIDSWIPDIFTIGVRTENIDWRTDEPRAAGGPVMPGRVYRVGEEGVELFTPDVPGRIIPHGESMRMMAQAPVASQLMPYTPPAPSSDRAWSGGGSTYNFYARSMDVTERSIGPLLYAANLRERIERPV